MLRLNEAPLGFRAIEVRWATTVLAGRPLHTVTVVIRGKVKDARTINVFHVAAVSIENTNTIVREAVQMVETVVDVGEAMEVAHFDVFIPDTYIQDVRYLVALNMMRFKIDTAIDGGGD